MHIVYKGDTERGKVWQAWLAEHTPDLHLHVWPETGDPEQVEVLIAWQPPQDFMMLFPCLRLVMSSGAGADQFNLADFPPDVQLVRMIEPGLTQGMVEYVTFAVLGLHRDMPHYLLQQREQVWRAHPAERAVNRRIGVMGLGELGQAALRQLVSLDFQCHGWSRTPRDITGVTCWHGAHQLGAFLQHSDILVCLLPLTAATRGILNNTVFDQLPEGACLVHVGRGAHLNDQHLLDALALGKLKAAIIDVTNPEPLPANHPFWEHPAIWLTPHIASQTHTESAIVEVLNTVRSLQRNEFLKGQINQERGY